MLARQQHRYRTRFNADSSTRCPVWRSVPVLPAASAPSMWTARKGAMNLRSARAAHKEVLFKSGAATTIPER